MHNMGTYVKQQILGLGKDSIIYGVGSVIIRFLGLFTLPLFTAYLSPQEYGVLAMLALLTMVAQPVFSLGLSAAMGSSYFERDSHLNKSKAVWTVFAIGVVSSTLLVGIAWVFPVFLGHLISLPDEYAPLVGLTLTGCALTILATSFTLRVQFEKQARLYVAVTLATALTATLVSIITVVFMEWGVTGMVIGQLAGNTVTFLSFLFIGLKATSPVLSVAMARELLRQGLPLVPSFAFVFILMHANKYIIEWQAGLDAVGIYSIGFNLGLVVSIVTGGIATAWYPFFMSYMERESEAKVVFGRILTYYVFAVGFICFLLSLAAKPLLLLLTKVAFHDAYVVVGLVALANFFQGAFNFLLPGLYYKREVKYVSIVQGLAAVLSLPFSYFLIVNMGVLGAGIGLVVGNFMMAALMYGWNSMNGSRYPNITYEWRRIFSFAFLLAAFFAFYVQLPATTITGEVIKSIFIGALATLSMYFLLNKKERSLLVITGKKSGAENG
jgi:O-antigen/teichoic acid export membrane protein